MVVTVAVTATFLVHTDVTLVLSLPTTTASDKIMYRRLSFQATIILKRERQQRVRLWTDADHDGNNLIRKEHSVASESYGDDTLTSLIGHFRSSGRDHEPEILPYTPLDMLERLEQENTGLKKRLEDLEQENQMLHYEVSSRIVLETFEGEGKMRRLAQQRHEQQKYNYKNDSIINGNDLSLPSLAWAGQDNMPVYKSSNTDDDIAGIWCDELNEDGACPVEPMVSFQEALRDRAYWLVGLLVLQSGSGIILAHNEDLLANHPPSTLLLLWSLLMLPCVYLESSTVLS